MIEVEAKLAAPSREVLDSIAALGEIAGFRTAPRDAADLETIYLDTSARALAAARTAVRIRRSRADVELTVKREGERDGDLRRRSEWTVPLGEMPVFPWPGTPALRRELGDALVEGALSPTVATMIRRRPVDLRDAAARLVAEIDLDEVCFRAFVGSAAGRESPPSFEVEVELRDGDEAALRDVVAALRRAYPLEPARFSKLERALRWAGLAR